MVLIFQTNCSRLGCFASLVRWQYLPIGNIYELLFYVWTSFHIDENENRRGSSLLEYGESQVLEVFMNTLPSRLYWILNPS